MGDFSDQFSRGKRPARTQQRDQRNSFGRLSWRASAGRRRAAFVRPIRSSSRVFARIPSTAHRFHSD
jgi:hypothetical protein